MRRNLNRMALAAACAAAFFALATPSTEAQVIRHPIQQQSGWYRIPGTSTRMYPAPRYYYQFGGTRIYPGRHSYGWPYGYPQGYSWSYGYPSNYVWPYSLPYSRGYRR